MMVLQPGTVLHSRYRIVKLLAQGGFGTLYRAWDTTLGRPCALKENLDISPASQRQFLREAKILAQLSHPNLPRVTDYFIAPQGQYLVMDFIEGRDLQEMLEDAGGPLPEDQVLPWIRQICDALNYLHTQKPPIIHRDIKPANIRITPQDQAMLIDFGIAKVYDPYLKTTVGAQAVTPGFSPYEQYGIGTSSRAGTRSGGGGSSGAAGGTGATDARTDIYALGATLFTLLTGQEPPESVQRMVRDPLRSPRQINPSISLKTAAAVMHAMQMDPTQRFQSAADFKSALSAAPPIPAAGATPPPPAVVPKSLPRQPVQWSWIGLGGIILLLILALFIRMGNKPGGSPLPATGIRLVEGGAVMTSTPATAAVWATLPSTSTLELAATSTLAPTLPPLIYTVQVGDTCSEIAQAYGVTVRSIATLNGLSTDCGLLYAGQTLLIPGDAHPPTVTPPPARPLATQVSLDDRMVMVPIPSGEFNMGSSEADPDADAVEKPQHRVYVSAFWMDQTEVTNAMYGRCVEDGDCKPPSEPGSKTRPLYFGDAHYDDYPVIYVSWEDANAYCHWAGRRLPTEAEWEKAARGTDGRIYPWGDALPTSSLANYGSQVGDTSPVGSYPSGSSPYGVFDMAGNVAEWVADWYGSDYYATLANTLSIVKNPSGPPAGEFRLLRGGSWFNKAWALRAAFRLWNYPELRSETIGFRCAH
jgi:formylglycine-generating enzyme required for sulfatase activity/serine/threonine protein kinase